MSVKTTKADREYALAVIYEVPADRPRWAEEWLDREPRTDTYNPTSIMGRRLAQMRELATARAEGRAEVLQRVRELCEVDCLVGTTWILKQLAEWEQGK